jgi:telomere length regulation protein
VLTSQLAALVDTILLAAGYLYRLDKDSLEQFTKTGMFLTCVSNRLAASIPRVRLLGMLVAVAVSRLTDGADKAMNFDTDEMDSDFAKSQLLLTQVHDEIGSIDDLKKLIKVPDAQLENATEPPRSSKKITRPVKTKPATSKIVAIEEIASSSESEDDLRPYAKPDSDASDSEDDPTLVNRSKPSAPVYITTLLTQLNVSDKPEVTELALRTAPDLIRRKADFGTELSENVRAVASSLINLKDGMHEPNLQNLRLQSLIACLITSPRIIAPWLCSTYFDGDFSLTQRATLLTVLGLGARELSGLKPDSSPPSDLFSSKRLPPHLASIYTHLSNASNQLTHSALQPLALAAADKLTGPDVLKVRTFSSRLEIQRRNAEKNAERTKRIPKDLHVLLSTSFYLPLCLRMNLLLASFSNSLRSTLFEPNIVRLFLQTSTVILHCLGPNAMQLNDVTRETLGLLSTLHNTVTLAYDPVVLPAMCQLLLTTLDLNVSAGTVAEERLVTEFGPALAELVRWTSDLADGRGGVSVPVAAYGEGEAVDGTGLPWTLLVAGIQVKWGEVGRKFQGRMMGLVGGEMEV